MSTALDAGQRVLRLEAAGIDRAARALGTNFAAAVDLLRTATGRIIVSGVGKSGLVAGKIAATLTSTGSPAMFLHPTDCLHGDLGIIGPGDAAILLSKSGETDELFGLLAFLERKDVPVVAITGGLHSTLARAARVVLDGGVEEEACPHDLAPTTSTTVAIALGDALAVALLELKGFSREAFASLHPGGHLGRRLLLKVEDVMVPAGKTLGPADPMHRAVEHLAHQRGIALVVDRDRLLGIVTAGDLSRIAERQAEYWDVEVSQVMTRTPKTVARGELAAAAAGVMERFGIMALPVVDGAGALQGVVHLHDLMRARAV